MSKSPKRTPAAPKTGPLSLKEHVGAKADDIAQITASDIVAWKDAAVARGLSAKTINDGYLGSAKAMLGYAVRNRLLHHNPAEGVRVASRVKAGTSMLPYSDDEVLRLLRLANSEKNPSRRWLPWLAASTGARIGELVQLWGKRIREVDGFPVMIIAAAEDGGGRSFSTT